MGQTTDELEHRIEEARNRLGQDLNQLEYRLKAATDWRAYFDRYPWAFVGLAFGGATIASAAFFGRKKRPTLAACLREAKRTGRPVELELR